MKKCITFALLALPLFVFAQQRLDLSGEWKVSLNNRGNQTIMLPNTLDGAGIGEPNTLSPALTKPQLSRLTRKHSFIGEAKYQREITITKEMAGKPLELLLERVMWRSRLLIDGQDAGQIQESLVSPHVFHIKGLTEGEHTLTLFIDNRKLHEISVDNLAHSYTNDTQIMWNGVLGRMELNVAPVITDVQIYPDIEKQQVSIKVRGSAADYGFTLDGCSVVPTKVGDGEYVWIFKPVIHDLIELLEQSSYVRFHTYWGWYARTDVPDEILDALHERFVMRQLYWDDIAIDEETLKPQKEVDKIVKGVLGI